MRLRESVPSAPIQSTESALHHLSKRDFVHYCFSDTGPVRAESVPLAGVRETFTQADLHPALISNGP